MTRPRRAAAGTLFTALFTMLALVTSALAQAPRKVLVLPLDGNAPEAQRTQLNASVVKLTREKIGGDVTVGETTFVEAASAVGCMVDDPACAESVRATLQVDELVYGSASTEAGNTTVVVNRVSAGTAPTSQTTVIAEAAPGSDAEAGLAPAFGAGSTPATERPRARNFFDSRERKLAVGLGAGGVIALAIGLSQWASKSSLQDDIDAHPTATLADINALRELEDRAASKALWGNILVITGAALIGAGGYFFWKDRQNRRATLTPAPVEQGAGMTLVLGGTW